MSESTVTLSANPHTSVHCTLQAVCVCVCVCVCVEEIITVDGSRRKAGVSKSREVLRRDERRKVEVETRLD